MKVAVMGTAWSDRRSRPSSVSLGHEVMMGSRSADNENAVEWAQGAGDGASNGTFADAAAFPRAVEQGGDVDQRLGREVATASAGASA